MGGGCVLCRINPSALASPRLFLTSTNQRVSSHSLMPSPVWASMMRTTVGVGGEEVEAVAAAAAGGERVVERWRWRGWGWCWGKWERESE